MTPIGLFISNPDPEIAYASQEERRTFQEEFSDPKWRQDVDQMEVFALLQRTIPEGAVEELRRTYRIHGEQNYLREPHPTGGNIYRKSAIREDGLSLNTIATYNNTRANKQEILAWLQRALELTY